MMSQKRYPTDVSDEEWAFVAPYLSLVRMLAPGREHSLREVLDGLRWIARTGAPWPYMPHDLPPWTAVHEHSQRWIEAEVFETIAHDLRALLRVLEGRKEQPSAAVIHARAPRSTPESGARAGNDPHGKTRGSKAHLGADTLGHLLAAVVTSASEQDRDAVAAVARATQEATGESVAMAIVDGADRGPVAHDAAREHGIRLEAVMLPEARMGFVLLPGRWVGERGFAWLRLFRRLAKDYGRLPGTLAGLRFVAFVCLMLSEACKLVEIGA